jgi:hypothetical protein
VSKIIPNFIDVPLSLFGDLFGALVAIAPPIGPTLYLQGFRAGTKPSRPRGRARAGHLTA